jgi:hypothetical protein
MEPAQYPYHPPIGRTSAPAIFLSTSRAGKPIVLHQVPDLIKIERPNIFRYQNQQEFIGHIKFPINEKPIFVINLEQYSLITKAGSSRHFSNGFYEGMVLNPKILSKGQYKLPLSPVTEGVHC